MKNILDSFQFILLHAYNNWHNHVSSFEIGNFMHNDFINGSPGKTTKINLF